jgi:hypothetical protein
MCRHRCLQKQHDLANHPLLGPARDNPLRTLGANAGHLAQSTRLLLDDVEHGFTKGANQLLRRDRPDAADHAGAQIFFDTLNRCRGRCLEERGSELDAVCAVIDPGSTRLNELACRDHRGVAENRDQVTLAARFDTQNTEAVLGVVKSHPVDQTGQNLGWRARPEWLRHPCKMNVEP